MFHQQFRIDYRSQLLVQRQMHLLITSVLPAMRSRMRNSILENLLHHHSGCLRLQVFQHDFKPRRPSTILKNLQRMPWRHKTNEKKLITRSQVDLFSSCGCLKQASVLRCCAVRTSCESWINKMSSNLLRYHCEQGAQ